MLGQVENIHIFSVVHVQLCMALIFGLQPESCVQDEGLCSLLLGTKQQQLGLAEYGATAHHFSAQPQQHLTGG